MRGMASILLFSTLAVAAIAQDAAPTTAPAPPCEAVLRCVPDDAHLVLVVPTLDGLVAGVAAFGRAIGAPEISEIKAADLLGPWLGPAVAGLDPQGPVVLVLSADCDEPLLLARAGPGESWTATTQPIVREGVTLYDFGPDHCVAATRGDVVVFARERGELRRTLDASGRGAARLVNELRPLWEQGQAALWIDVPGWRPRVDAQTTALWRGMQVGMAAAGPDAEIGLPIWNWMLDQFKRTLADTATATVGLRVGGDGLHVDARLTFQPDTAAARYLAQVRRPKRDLLRGLAAGPAPLVLAYEWEDSVPGSGLSEALARVIAGMDSIKQKVGPEKLQAVMQMSAEVNRKIPGSSAVFSLCPDGPGLLYWGLYLTSEGPTVRREMQHICELTPELVSAWGTFPAAMKGGAVETIAGVEADVYEFTFGGDESALQPLMPAIYGHNPTLYMAPHREGVAYAFGPREHARAQLAGLLAPDAPPLAGDPRVTAVRRVLAPNPQGCLLLDLPALAATATTMLAQLGAPVPQFEPPATDAALIGLSWYLEPRAVRAQLYVPTAPLKALVRYAQRVDKSEGGDY